MQQGCCWDCLSRTQSHQLCCLLCPSTQCRLRQSSHSQTWHWKQYWLVEPLRSSTQLVMARSCWWRMRH